MSAAAPISLGAVKPAQRVEELAVKEDRKDAPANSPPPSPLPRSASPFEPARDYPNTRVAILADHICRNLVLLRAHLEGNGKRVMPMAAHDDLERIQAELTATFVAWRNHVSDFPPIVTGRLDAARPEARP